MKGRTAGFTLLEVLVVVAVMGLVLALLAQTVQIGVHAMNAFQGRVRAQVDFEPVEQALRRMVERMDPGIYPQPPLLRGTAASFVFTTELPDAATGGSMAADIRLEAAGGQLRVEWAPHGRGVAFASPPPPRRTVLLDAVARLELAYAPKGAAGAWRDRWAAEELPGLVRIHVVPAAGNANWPAIVARPLRERAEE